jgi:hypothetical protein
MMIEATGKYTTAKVFTDNLEASARGQIQALCDQAFTAGSKIRIMPDVHAGKGCTINKDKKYQRRANDERNYTQRLELVVGRVFQTGCK